MNYKQIIWLASYPKSGNTWLRVFLEAYLLPSFNINQIVTSIGDDISTRHSAGLGKDPREYPIQVQQLTRHMALLRLVELFDQEKPIEGFPLCVKTHNSNHIPNGVTMIPEQLTKSVVHIIRDPRDVAISFSKHLGCSIDKTIDHMSDKLKVLTPGEEQLKMLDFISSWKEHTRSYVENDILNVKTFRYEDMHLDSVKTFSAILEHIGIEPDAERVKKALDDVEISKLREREKKEGFVESSPKNKDGFFGKGGTTWRDTLEPFQIKRIEKMAGSFMERFGYKGNGNIYH